MNSWYQKVDQAIALYVTQNIESEIHKDLEDLIFFSSYTIGFELFKEATQKLRESLQKDSFEDPATDEEIRLFLKQYHLATKLSHKKHHYIARELIKAHIAINEAVMEHFGSLHKKAHSFDYLEGRASEIYKLLDDLTMDKI